MSPAAKTPSILVCIDLFSTANVPQRVTPAPGKTALGLKGLITDELRAPMQRSSDAMVGRLKEVLGVLGSDNR